MRIEDIGNMVMRKKWTKAGKVARTKNGQKELSRSFSLRRSATRTGLNKNSAQEMRKSCG